MMPATLRSTPYADEIQTTSIGEIRIERILIHSEDQEEIRFSWWPNGNMANRPLDIPESTLVELMAKAINEGTISKTFLPRLVEETRR
jgi:hypothetical protein